MVTSFVARPDGILGLHEPGQLQRRIGGSVVVTGRRGACLQLGLNRLAAGRRQIRAGRARRQRPLVVIRHGGNGGADALDLAGRVRRVVVTIGRGHEVECRQPHHANRGAPRSSPQRSGCGQGPRFVAAAEARDRPTRTVMVTVTASGGPEDDHDTMVAPCSAASLADAAWPPSTPANAAASAAVRARPASTTVRPRWAMANVATTASTTTTRANGVAWPRWSRHRDGADVVEVNRTRIGVSPRSVVRVGTSGMRWETPGGVDGVSRQIRWRG